MRKLWAEIDTYRLGDGSVCDALALKAIEPETLPAHTKAKAAGAVTIPAQLLDRPCLKTKKTKMKQTKNSNK